MKRIIALVTIAILFLPITLALDDFTPTDQPDFIDQTQQQNTLVCSQAVAGVSQLISRNDILEAKINETLKKSDLAQFETAVDEKFDRKIGQILARMITILLVFTAFFFSILFLTIAKGWINFNKTPQTRQPQKIPIKTTENKKKTPGILEKKPKKEDETEMNLETALKQFEEEDLFETEPKPPEPEEEFNEEEAAKCIVINQQKFR